MARGKSILLVIGGGVAAYKALFLIRRLAEAGVATRAVLTRAGAEFVTPLSVAALTGDKVYSDLFSLTDEAEMGHIELSRSADLVVVAPATADLMAKCAAGLANDLASTALLATDKPVLMAPAMNVRMWEHPAVRRNLETLKADGVAFVGPDEGAMACGEYGPGRMAEPDAIAEAVLARLGDAPAGAGALAGRKAVVTAGPTQEPLDPVRYLANRSSGKQGYAVAGALARLGAEVTLVSGPTALDAPPGVTRVDVGAALEMETAVKAALPADIFVAVAAVADWRPDAASGSKRKKSGGGPPALTLVENPDILAGVARSKSRPALVVGFAAETDDVEANARAKLDSKGADWIVANDVSGDAMGGDDNEIALITRDGAERWPRLSKRAVADRLARRIAETLSTGDTS